MNFFKSKKRTLENFCPWFEIINASEIHCGNSEIASYFDNSLYQNKDGSLSVTFEIVPDSNFNSGDVEEERAYGLSKAIADFPDDILLNFETRRSKSSELWYEDRSSCMSDTPLSAEIEKIRFNQSVDENPYVTSIYWTITKPEDRTLESDGAMENFYKLLKKFSMQMENIGIKSQLLCGEKLLTYLHSTVSAKKQTVPVVHKMNGAGGIEQTLCDMEINHLSVPMQFSDGTFISAISMDGLPDTINIDCFSAITQMNTDVRICIRFRCLSQASAEKKLTILRNRHKGREISLLNRILYRNSVDSAPEETAEISDTEECSAALDSLVGRDISFGFYTGVMLFYSANEKELRENVDEAEKILMREKFLVHRETLNLFSSFLSCIPANYENNARVQLVSTENIACMQKLSIAYSGGQTNNYLKKITGCGTPLAYGYNSDGAPYFFNPNGADDDVGHTFIVGPTGSGKSCLLSLIASSWNKYPNTRTIIFDKGMSSSGIVRGNNGTVVNPGVDDCVFQPFGQADSVMMNNFIDAVLKTNNCTLSPQERKNVSSIVESFSNFTEQNRTLETFSKMLFGKNHNSPLGFLLSDYQKGMKGKLFAGCKDYFPVEESNMLMVETQNLMNMGEGVITPALVYMFDRLRNLFSDKKPTILILDECWAFLANEMFRDYIVEMLKTARKNNCFVIMATQNIADMKMDELAQKTIVSECHTRIFLADSNAENEALAPLYLSLGLLPYHLSIISKMQRKRDYYIIQNEGEALVDFKMERHIGKFAFDGGVV